MTAVHRNSATFIWETTYLTALTNFQNAVLRWTYSIKRHYNNRLYSNLTGIVSDMERARYPTIAQIDAQGNHTPTTIFTQAIKDAETAANLRVGNN